MNLFQNTFDFNHYLRIQIWMFLPALLISVVLAYTRHSGWCLLAPIATIPLAYLFFQMLHLTGEGAVDILFGMGRGNLIYSKSLLFDGDMEKANALRREAKLPEAILLYKKIIELAPDRAEPLFEMANTYRMSREGEKARAAYIKVATRFAESLGREHFFVREARDRARELAGRANKTGRTGELPG